MYKSRLLALVIICCCIVSLFAVPGIKAEAGEVDNITDTEAAFRLSKLGMITGNAKGDFMLQSKLKRSEATQFIVNLIGKNKYVKDNKDTYSSTIYKDVKKTDWFAPSVGYCQQAGIVTVNDKFNPGDSVTEKQFLGMVIQALGYSTPDDFSWATVFQMAYDIGLVSDPNYQVKTDDNKEFKRGNVVQIMYRALGLRPKTEDMSLLQKMVYEDVITYETAVSSKILKDEVLSKIVEIKPLNEQRIKVIFNEKIGKIDPESIQINDNSNGNELTVSSVAQTDTELIIKTSKQVATRKYTIEFKKFIDFEGNTLEKLTGQFNGFTVVEVVSDLFKISKIEQKDQDEVNVYFTHPVNENAVNSSFYEIYENNSTFIKASPSDSQIKLLPENKGITIALKSKKFTSDQEYSISVSPELMSGYGVYFVKQNELDTFIAKDMKQQSINGFAIEQVTGISKNTLQVDFTMDVNNKIAEQIYMYSLTDSNNKAIEIKAAKMLTDPGKSVLLSINGTLDSSRNYNLMVNFMRDATNQYTIDAKSQSFDGDVSEGVEFQLFSVDSVDTSSINVTFSKPLSEKALSDLTNFTLLDTKNPSFKLNPDKAVVSTEDVNTVRLFFSKDKKLLPDMTYTLRLSSRITDFTGYSLTGQLDYVFDSDDISETSMSIEKAVKISDDTIKVVFSSEISTDNFNTGNYSIDYYENGQSVKKVPIAITHIDSKVIVLKFDTLPEDIDCTFSYKQIKGIGGEIYNDTQKNSIKVTVAK